jgi:D-arabinose 1-dehydrogenase-like Zn-dependent alcohol dehydrogenase
LPVRTTVTPFSVDEAEDALSRLRAGAIEGAAVVLPAS